MNQAGRGDPLGIFHEPIERPSNGHQSLDLLSPDIGDGAWFAAMPGLCSKLLATLLQPKVQAVEIPKWGAWIARAGVELPERSSQSVRFATYAAFGHGSLQPQPDAGLQNSGSKR
jgi:hypothetical protein